ncbi:MAG: transketolase [Chloroflexota bacterium]|nr:transketolase [Chloroflexota bacterium]
MDIDQLCINTIRFLAVDTVEKAKSGHPGAPMGIAPMAYVLWDRFLKHDPSDPNWQDRDRFVLSAGHASALLYSLLYLTGYELTLNDLKCFRQLGSITPGHPEYRRTPGVEVTTGPLGQGFANGVGMAIVENWMAQHYNRPGFDVINHYTYAIVSDGDLQEGISSEAASLAGTLQLGKIIYLYDDNGISIEGPTDLTFTENVAQRFEAYGWQVIGPIDGMNVSTLESALSAAQVERAKPSILICKTIIGYGSPNKQDTALAHGEPLGEEEVRLAKRNLGWPYKEPFIVPKDALNHLQKARVRGKHQNQEWQSKMESYRQAYPKEAIQMQEDLKRNQPKGWDKDLSGLIKAHVKSLSTRDVSGITLNATASNVHSLIGGSADLAPSTKTTLKRQSHPAFDKYVDHNIHFGVREHAMGAIANGMSLHGGAIPYTGTFLAFCDYMRPPIRLASMMEIQVIFIFTHDSIGLGEDGPTHQPIEQTMSLRLIHNLVTIRPADAGETIEAWKVAIERHDGPTALILSRQDLPVLERHRLAPASKLRQGAYVLWESRKSPEALLISTGSEVQITLEAGQILEEKGIGNRVISMPSWELFDAQSIQYRNSVLPPAIRARVSLEAGTTLGWERYVGLEGKAMGISRFGASAPYQSLYKEFGLTAQNMAHEARLLLEGRSRQT